MFIGIENHKLPYNLNLESLWYTWIFVCCNLLFCSHNFLECIVDDYVNISEKFPYFQTHYRHLMYNNQSIILTALTYNVTIAFDDA